MKKNVSLSEKHRRIIAAAKDLFNRTHDVKKVSLEAIAAAARVSPTTIYNKFKDRETLILEVVKDLISQNLERNRVIVLSDIPFEQKIMAVMRSKLEIAEKVNEEIVEKIITQDKKVAPYIDEIYESEIKPLWSEMMAEGRKLGYIDPVISDAAILAYMDIIQAGLKTKNDYFTDFKNNMDIIIQLTRIFFYGFLKKDIDLFRKEEK